MVSDRECYILSSSYILSQKSGGRENGPIHTVCEIPPSCNCFQLPWQVEKNWCDHNFSESHQFGDVCTVFEAVSKYIRFISFCFWFV